MIYIGIIAIILLFGVYKFCEYLEDKHWHEKNPTPKNFQFKWKGQNYWYSRACAVSLFLLAKNEQGQYCVLANKRGENTPNYKGLWNCPCGYLDFNENSFQAAQRECMEETNVFIPVNRIELWDVDTNPDKDNQNVTIHHVAILDNRYTTEFYLSNKNSKNNEVDAVKWIPLQDVELYDWAFDHYSIIKAIESNKI